MKTNTLTGADLNRAVAMALGLNVKHYRTWLETVNEYWKGKDCSFAAPDEYRVMASPDDGTTSRNIPDYAGDISEAWPIIKREKIEVRYQITDSAGGGYWFCNNLFTDKYGYTDQDPIVAALRCFVAGVYGDDINLEE
jgi:hypothetical protein